MKSLVFYDKETGNVEDCNGMYIATGPIGMHVATSSPGLNDKNPSNVEAIIKLKSAGFTAEDIIKMGFAS